MRRRISLAVVGFAAVAIVATGCKSSDTARLQERPPEAKPVTVLAESYKKIEAHSFKFTSTVTIDEMTVISDGAYDLARKVGLANVEFAGHKIQMRIFDHDLYIEMMGRWLHVDTTKLPIGNSFAGAANPVGNADYLLAASDDVKRVGEHTYRGTLDLHKYLDKYAKPGQKEQVEKMLDRLGPQAYKVPFEAVVDDQGRLTALTTTMKIERHGKTSTVVQKLKFFDFGTEVSVEKPPADKIKDAPTGMYHE
jgi:hypothetical protein